MRILLFIILSWCSLLAPLAAQQAEPLQQKISLDIKEQSIKEILDEIHNIYQINFIYSENILPAKKITLSIKEKPLEDVLKQIFKDTELQYKQSGNSILIGKKKKDRTVSGYIEDGKSGERLINAYIYDTRSGRGTVSNSYGFYSLTLPEDTILLLCSYIGYTFKPMLFFNSQDTFIHLKMQPSLELSEVVVTHQESTASETSMGTIDIPAEQLKKLPAVGGEPDILKSIQMLPGVQAGNEGSTGINIRGGGPDQNLILLDDVPVYNVSHLLGFFSIFNADAINNVQLIKGAYPARYGGRLSGVLDIRMKEGNMHKWHGEGSIGMVASRFTLEGPIKKEKTSFMISGRRTYLDLLLKPLFKLASMVDTSENNFNLGYHFYDINAKVNHKFSNKDRLYISLYLGQDQLKFVNNTVNYDSIKIVDMQSMRINWGNKIAAIRWNHIFGSKTFSNTSLTYSRYKFSMNEDHLIEITAPDSTKSAIRNDIFNYSGVEDVSIRLDIDHIPSSRHYIRTGAYAIYHSFQPSGGYINSNSTSDDVASQFVEDIPAIEAAVYIEDDHKFSDDLKINAGVHISSFYVQGRNYISLQPRLSSRYLLAKDLALKASFARTTQYLHLLSNFGIGFPTDLWVPPTDKVQPQDAWQFSAGIAATKGKIDISLEGYYKQMYNLIEYQDHAGNAPSFSSFEDLVISGDGESYGGEIMLLKKKGRTTGWIAYTLSWSNRVFEEINEGRKFPYKYDRRHDLGITLSHKFNEKVSLNGTFTFRTGFAVTLPEEEFLALEHIPVLGNYYNSIFGSALIYGDRNSYRMPNYHRLDVAFAFHKQRKKFSRTFNIGLYNLYNRHNSYYINYRYSFFKQKGEFRGISFFPLMPMMSYDIKF